MKALIDITEEMYNRIKEVSRDFSLQSFILMAIENQISLEKEQHNELIDLNMKKKKSQKLVNRSNLNLNKPRRLRNQLKY